MSVLRDLWVDGSGRTESLVASNVLWRAARNASAGSVRISVCAPWTLAGGEGLCETSGTVTNGGDLPWI